MAAAPIFIDKPKAGVVRIVNADGVASKVVVTAGAAGTKIVSVMATSTDTVGRVFQMHLTRAGVHYLIGSVTVAAMSGSNGAVPGANMLSVEAIPGLPVDSDGQGYLLLQSGDTLTVAAQIAVTAAKEVCILATAGDF